MKHVFEWSQSSNMLGTYSLQMDCKIKNCKQYCPISKARNHRYMRIGISERALGSIWLSDVLSHNPVEKGSSECGVPKYSLQKIQNYEQSQ